ncbi:unnamed protein product [Menidia menidia]|uniref:(Atlantic silverside) hypothetical protein n=1 Tax=Menidia menidia TaxID=238744 RepID=A0A8S4BC97_9TELE|nr:unnamed protein product [Menidia menidia]
MKRSATSSASVCMVTGMMILSVVILTYLAVGAQVTGTSAIAYVPIPSLFAHSGIATGSAAASLLQLAGAEAADTQRALNLCQAADISALAVDEEVTDAAHVAVVKERRPNLGRQDEFPAGLLLFGTLRVAVAEEQQAAGLCSAEVKRDRSRLLGVPLRQRDVGLGGLKGYGVQCRHILTAEHQIPVQRDFRVAFDGQPGKLQLKVVVFIYHLQSREVAGDSHIVPGVIVELAIDRLHQGFKSPRAQVDDQPDCAALQRKVDIVSRLAGVQHQPVALQRSEGKGDLVGAALDGCQGQVVAEELVAFEGGDRFFLP